MSELVEKNEKLAAFRAEHSPKPEPSEAKPLIPVPGTLHVLAKGLDERTTGSIRERKPRKPPAG